MNRAYYEFITQFSYKNNNYEVKYWVVRINQKHYAGKTLQEFFKLIDSFNYSITLWSWEFDLINSNIIKKYLLSQSHLTYLEKFKHLTKNTWTQFTNHTNDNCYIIKYYNHKKNYRSFLSTQKSSFEEIITNVKEIANQLKINYWDISNEEILALSELGKRRYLELKINIIEYLVELNLSILNFTGKRYRISMSSYSSWWWKNNQIFYWKDYFGQKIPNQTIWKELNNAFNRPYDYVHQKLDITKKTLQVDKRTAYGEILVNKKMPYLNIIKCDQIKCNHELSIEKYEYNDFKLRNGRLPIFYSEFNNKGQYLKEGKSIIYSSIKEEHEKISQSYEYSWKIFLWKCCFESTNIFFHDYFQHFFKLKELNKDNFIGLIAKKYCVLLWTNFMKLKQREYKTYIKKDNKDILKTDKVFLNLRNEAWIEKVVNLNSSEKNTKDLPYIPIAIFTTAYQRLETIKMGEMNYNRFISANVDEITLYDDLNEVKRLSMNANQPLWAEILGLGRWKINNNDN